MVFLYLTIFLSITILYIRKHNYKVERFVTLDKKIHPLLSIYPISYYLLEQLSKYKPIQSIYAKYIWNEKSEEYVNGIYVGEDKKLASNSLKCKQLSTILLVSYVLCIFGILLFVVEKNNSDLKDGQFIYRPKLDQNSDSIVLDAYIEEDGSYDTYQYNVDINTIMYNEEEATEYFLSFCESLENYILGENESLEHITHDLVFPKKIPSTSIPLRWSTDHVGLIDKNGKIRNENLLDEEIAGISIQLNYLNLKLTHEFYITICPLESIEGANITLEQKLKQNIDELMSKTRTEEIIQLPSRIDDKKIYWQEVKESKQAIIFILGITSMIALMFTSREQLRKEHKKREQQMLYDYSEIISKLCLFLRAGMSLATAWDKITTDYLEQKEVKRYAYEEMQVSRNEMKLGMDEILVLETFGKRMKLAPYLRLVSLITQNIQKGNEGLLLYLEYEAKDAFLERKELVKRLGEEAGTKLLIPMMIMLLLVLVIIMVPAYMSFGL